MKLQMVQNALKQKNIKYEYTEEDDCGSLVFMCGNITMKSGEQRQISMKQAEARISRAITKKKLLQRFCHGRI